MVCALVHLAMTMIFAMSCFGVSCPGGHCLQQLEGPARNICDVCDKRMYSSPIYHQCKMCDYDICHVCFAKKTEEAENKRNREKQTESRLRAKNALERLGGFWKNGQETFHITRSDNEYQVEFPEVTMNIKVLSDRLHLYYGVYGESHVWELELDSDEDNMFCRHLNDETHNCRWEREIPLSLLGDDQMKEIDEAVKNHLRRGQIGESKLESVKKFVQELNMIMKKRPKTSQYEIAERIQKVYPESWKREQSRLKRLRILPESWFVTANERKKKILEILQEDLAKGPNQEYPFADDLLFVMGFHEWLMK